MQGGCRPAEDLRWYPVDKAVGNGRNQGAELIEPISEERLQSNIDHLPENRSGNNRLLCQASL